MTRLLLWFLKTWTGETYVSLSSVLDAVPMDSDCGRLIRVWVVKTREG